MNGRQMAPNNNQHGFQATPVNLSHPQSQMPVFGIQYPYGGTPINLAESSQLPVYDTNDNGYAANPQMLIQSQIEGSLINNDQQLSQLPIHHEHTVNPQMLVNDQVDGTPINFAQPSQLSVHHMNDSEYTTNPQILAHNQIEGTPINHGQQLSQLPIHHEYTINPQMLVNDQVDRTPIKHSQQSQSIDYTDSVGYLNNPHMFAHPQAEGTPINDGQQSQLHINGNQHQALDFSHDFGDQQQSQMSTDYTDSARYLNNPHMFAHPQAEGTPINDGQQSQLIINDNQHQAQDFSHNFGQQQTQIQGHHTSDIASIDYPFQNGSINFDLPLSIPVNATDNNGHDISQRVPAHCGQQPPQMPVNQANFNGVNNNRQSIQAITTTRISSFANLSAEDQNAEFRHFFQQRLTQGDTTGMEFAIFKSWYIGEQLKGKNKPTLAYGVTPLHQTLRFDSSVPKHPPMIPPNNRPRPTLNGQAMRPNNERYLQKPRKSTKSNIPERRASKAVASAGQSPLPVSLPCVVQPALPSTTRVQAPTPLATAMPASLSTTKDQAPTPSAIAVSTLPSTTRAQASTQSAMAMPAVTRKGRKLQIGNPQQIGIITSAKGKEIPREQRNEATSAAQPTIIRVDQIRSLAGRYTISLSNLPDIIHYEESSDEDIFHTLDAAIQAIDAKIAAGTDKVYMPRDNDSRTMVEMALRAILQRSIARLSLDISSDARKSLEDYAASKNISHSSIKSLEFAPESQFVEEEIKAVGGSKQTVRLAKDGVPACATHKFMWDTIECNLNGIEVKGSYSLYTKTTFTNATTPLKYAIELKTQVAEIGNHRARSGLLTYERPLPSNVAGEPRWADVLDLFELQAAEWSLNTRIQGSPTSQTLTSTTLSNKQQNGTKRSDAKESDVEQQLPFSRPVQGQRAKAGQQLTPEQQKGRGDKRKREQQPELHASPVISTSSSGDSSPLSNSSSQISNATTGTMSVSPRPVAELSRLLDISQPSKRSRNGYGQPPMNRIYQNDHMHPARSPSESVRSPIATATQNLMPAQVSTQDSRLHVVDAMSLHRQAMLLYANNPRPYKYPTSESTQPSRTLSTRSDMPTQMQAQLLRTPTEAELAPHREQVLSVWKSSFPKEKKSS
ncbi:hypothetical protein BOTCAL_0406g00050 [Botryotinia calthae]|uniref:Uncharacterized protein n=1 Tax=Botryotinia calthae TaxID=38488 RepID=A0A4Y8CQU4_9HELO|nr:hypothetical protein BOTCAL_0406g00050 [Botryotinia calthae]